MSGSVWQFRPARHKGQWQGKDRVIRFGPKAQAILQPLLQLDAEAAILSPGDALEEIRVAKRAKRGQRLPEIDCMSPVNLDDCRLDL